MSDVFLISDRTDKHDSQNSYQILLNNEHQQVLVSCAQGAKSGICDCTVVY